MTYTIVCILPQNQTVNSHLSSTLDGVHQGHDRPPAGREGDHTAPVSRLSLCTVAGFVAALGVATVKHKVRDTLGVANSVGNGNRASLRLRE